MPYTFGGATSDVITLSPATAFLSGNTQTLVAGWYYPTVLTAGRALFGLSSTRLEIDTTTTQLRSVGAQATTSSQSTYSLTSVPLSINNWFFIAWYTSRAGANETHDMWIGTETLPPEAMTRTAVVAGSGSLTIASAMTIGNQTSNTASFQGDIANLAFFYQVTSTFGAGAPLEASNGGGSRTTSDLELILRKVIKPLWQGTFDMRSLASNPAMNMWAYSIPLDSDVALRYQTQSNTASSPSQSMTVSGATLSQTRPPTLAADGWSVRRRPIRR